MHKPIDFSRPEPAEAGPVITLKISGNRLIGLLNSLDNYAFNRGHRWFDGNEFAFAGPHDRELWELTESIRDEISAQRCNTTADDIRASCRRYK